MSEIVAVLEEGRQRERRQALFYRFLAGEAESAGDARSAERLNELLADEQHHVSRLTARILELGEKATDTKVVAPEIPPLDGWETVARAREEEEVHWYTAALERVDDAATRGVLQEILISEKHHRDELAGKWMSASSNDPEEEV